MQNNWLSSHIEKKTKEEKLRLEFLSNVSHELKMLFHRPGMRRDCGNASMRMRKAGIFNCEVIMDQAVRR